MSALGEFPVCQSTVARPRPKSGRQLRTWAFLKTYLADSGEFNWKKKPVNSCQKSPNIQWFLCIVFLYATYKVWSQLHGMFLAQFLLIEKIIWNICPSLTQTDDIESVSAPQPRIREWRPQNAGNALSETQEETLVNWTTNDLKTKLKMKLRRGTCWPVHKYRLC